jgi:hypothetical protein
LKGVNVKSNFMGILNDIYNIYIQRKPCFGKYKYGEYETLCDGAKNKCCRDVELCKLMYERNIENGSDKSTNGSAVTE